MFLEIDFSFSIDCFFSILYVTFNYLIFFEVQMRFYCIPVKSPINQPKLNCCAILRFQARLPKF